MVRDIHEKWKTILDNAQVDQPRQKNDAPDYKGTGSAGTPRRTDSIAPPPVRAVSVGRKPQFSSGLVRVSEQHLGTAICAANAAARKTDLSFLSCHKRTDFDTRRS